MVACPNSFALTPQFLEPCEPTPPSGNALAGPGNLEPSCKYRGPLSSGAEKKREDSHPGVAVGSDGMPCSEAELCSSGISRPVKPRPVVLPGAQGSGHLEEIASGSLHRPRRGAWSKDVLRHPSRCALGDPEVGPLWPRPQVSVALRCSRSSGTRPKQPVVPEATFEAQVCVLPA